MNKPMSSFEAVAAGLTYKQWLATLPDDSWKRQYASQLQGKLWFEAVELGYRVDKRQRRLAKNEVIRKRNQQRQKELEQQPQRYSLTTEVMKPT